MTSKTPRFHKRVKQLNAMTNQFGLAMSNQFVARRLAEDQTLPHWTDKPESPSPEKTEQKSASQIDEEALNSKGFMSGL